MKLSNGNKFRRFLISPKYRVYKAEARASTERSKNLSYQALSPVLPDPFKDINKGNPNSKLQPILLRERLSPNPMIERISIRLPEITSEGKLKTSRHFLPALNSPFQKNFFSPTVRKEAIFRFRREHFMLRKNPSETGLKYKELKLEASEKMDVSFGNSCWELGSNPFTSNFNSP